MRPLSRRAALLLAPPMHRALWLLCLARVADAGRSRKKLSLEEEWQKLDEFCQTLASCDTCMDNAEVVNNKGCGWCMESEVTARAPGQPREPPPPPAPPATTAPNATCGRRAISTDPGFVLRRCAVPKQRPLPQLF